jgi:hypothetical protein
VCLPNGGFVLARLRGKMIDAYINGNHFDRGNSVVQELRCMFKPVEREQLDQPMQNQPSKGYDKA